MHRYWPKGTHCQQAAKPNQMQTGVCSPENQGLLVEETVQSPESEVGTSLKTWLPMAPRGWAAGKTVHHGG